MNPFKTKLAPAIDKDEVAHPKKKPVSSTIMYLDRTRSGTLLRFNILYWELKYDKLKYEDAEYVHFVPSPNWSLVVTKRKVTRRKDSVTVVILTKECKTMIQGFVVYQVKGDRKRHSESIIAEEVGDKRYKIKFPTALIHNKKNKCLLKKHRLVLGFMFDAKRLMDSKAELYLEEMDETNSLMVAYENRFFTDFIIRSNGEEFHVHKAILAARSNYFYHNEHQQQNEITIDASRKTIEDVIHFLYSGELPLLTLNELMDVLELSVKLHVTSLVDLCSLYLGDVMTADNVERIRDVAIRTGVRKLIGVPNRIRSSSLRENSNFLAWFSPDS